MTCECGYTTDSTFKIEDMCVTCDDDYGSIGSKQIVIELSDAQDGDSDGNFPDSRDNRERKRSRS